MSNIQTGAERMPHDHSHLGFLAGQIGRLITISTTPVIAGDSFEMDAVGALRLSPLRRGLAINFMKCSGFCSIRGDTLCPLLLPSSIVCRMNLSFYSYFHFSCDLLLLLRHGRRSRSTSLSITSWACYCFFRSDLDRKCGSAGMP